MARKMSVLSSTDGNPIHKILSNRPGRKIAGSMISKKSIPYTKDLFI